MGNNALIALGVAVIGGGAAYWLWKTQQDEGADAEVDDQVVTPPEQGMGIPKPSMPPTKSQLIDETIIEYQEAGKAALEQATTKAKKIEILLATSKAVKYLKDNKASLVKRSWQELTSILRFQAGLLEARLR